MTRVALLACAFVGALSASALAQSPFPDLAYYRFDEGGGSTTANLASPGVGSNPAAVSGMTLDPAGGQFAGSLLGVGGSIPASMVDTGWSTSFPSSFSIAFWLDLTAITTANPFMYVFGDTTAQSLRCFTNGASGTGNITMRSTLWSTGVIVTGGGDITAPHHITFVYDASVPELRGYLDGVRVATTPIAAASHTGATTGSFKVGGYSSSILAGVRLDEFRIYDSALSDADVTASWNASGGSGGTPPVVYCTAGTTTSGCVPSISGTGAASATATSGFSIDVAAVEGQKQGLIFYGIDNTGFTPLPWGASFFCVKAPTQRSFPQSSGGANGMCDGALSLDWNAYQATTPGALGQPFSIGQKVYAQAWFRDPPSAKTTAFSDALEFTVGP